jgi:hypothetical protein
LQYSLSSLGVISMGRRARGVRGVKSGAGPAAAHSGSATVALRKPNGHTFKMAAKDSAAAWSAFLGGITPRLLLEDVYRAGECYLCDVADVLEKEVLRLCEEQQRRAQGALRGGAARGAAGGGGGGGGGSSSSSSSSSSGGGPTDSSLHAEVAAGADFVWQTMLQAYELVGDQFELYATRNVFMWPEGVEFSVRGSPRPRPREPLLPPHTPPHPATCPPPQPPLTRARRARAAASCTRPPLRTPRMRA